MPPTPPDPSEPQNPRPGQRRAYQPPPGAAKPQPSPAADRPASAGPPPMAGGPGARPPMSGGPGGRPPMPSGAAAAAAAGVGKRPGVALRGGGFEFTFQQDELLKDLARNIRTVSWVLLLLAALLLVRQVPALFDSLRTGNWRAIAEPLAAVLGAGLCLYTFVALRRCGGTFSDIVDSEGQDAPLLIQALRTQNRMFTVLSMSVVVIAALIVAGVLLATVFSGGGNAESGRRGTRPGTSAPVGKVAPRQAPAPIR